MKKIIIVNNNMKIGGIQKALISLLNEISDKYDITLFLFSATGKLIDQIPPNVKIIECKSFYKYLGISQEESKKNICTYVLRTILASLTKIFGLSKVVKLLTPFTKKVAGSYDVAISYLHNGSDRDFYGGCNQFVLNNIYAGKKITFLHGDYRNCGSNFKDNNLQYCKFDYVAACSEGCRRVFLDVIPSMKNRCKTVVNCHKFKEIIELANDDPVSYDNEYTNILIVARLNIEKGIDRALHAVKYSSDKNFKVRLHILGDGILKDSLVLLSEELGISSNVFFYGEQNNPYRFMKNADFLMIASYHEAAPLVIDEAISLGLPVLSTETISSKDMIIDRDCGWVCQNSQESINEKMSSILANPALIEKKKIEITLYRYSNNDIAVKMFNELIE